MSILMTSSQLKMTEQRKKKKKKKKKKNLMTTENGMFAALLPTVSTFQTNKGHGVSYISSFLSVYLWH